MSPPKFFSRFSKKLKHKFAGDGRKPGGSGTDVDGVSVDESKGDGDEGGADLMGLPLLPENQEAAPDGGREPELGQNRTDVDKGEVDSMDPSLQLGGEKVPGNGRRREGNEMIVKEQVVLVNPPSQSDLGISQRDQGRSGGMCHVCRRFTHY